MAPNETYAMLVWFKLVLVVILWTSVAVAWPSSCVLWDIVCCCGPVVKESNSMTVLNHRRSEIAPLSWGHQIISIHIAPDGLVNFLHCCPSPQIHLLCLYPFLLLNFIFSLRVISFSSPLLSFSFLLLSSFYLGCYYFSQLIWFTCSIPFT